MRVVYKPHFILGEVEAILENEDGTLRAAPLYHFIGDNGTEVFSFKHSDFEYAGDNSDE